MSIYDYSVRDSKGNLVNLLDYKGKVVLIVNTATRCGFTPQYEGLEKLYLTYKDKGLEILDFPCNQFLGQAPGTDEEIVSYCTLKYNVTFKIFSKINVNGRKADPLFVYLKEKAPSRLTRSIKWNFTKFLIGRDGEVVKRFEPNIKPEDLASAIEKLL